MKISTSPLSAWRMGGPLILLLALLSPNVLTAQPQLLINGISLTNGTVNLRFTDQRLATKPALAHYLEFSSSLGASASWTRVNGAVLTATPSNNLGRLFTLPAAAGKGFYRIVSPIPFGITIDQFDRGTGNVNIQFSDQRLATNPVLNYAVEFTRFLGPAAVWTNISGVTFAKVTSNTLARAVTVNASTPSGFYRVVGIPYSTTTTTNDSDGDGIPDSLEITLGTNPNSFDTDGDGFSDGVEYQYGSNPNDPNSVPILTDLPRAEFAAASSTATEGTAPHTVAIHFDKPYFGNVKFGVLTNSTALVNVDYLPLPATLPVSGSDIVIPITWIDNAIVNPTRLLILQIQTDPTLPYARGGQNLHTVVLDDNDYYWSGVLSDTFAERNFRLQLTHSNSVSRATFVAGYGNDGLPLLTSDTNAVKSSQSEGVVPNGTFPASVLFDSTNHFSIISPAMAAATGGLFGPSTGLTRKLTLDCLPSTNGTPNSQSIVSGRIIGKYTECLAFPTSVGCVASQTGDFVLVRDIPARPAITP